MTLNQLAMLILGILAAGGVGFGMINNLQKKSVGQTAAEEKRKADKYRNQRDASQAVARILVEHQDNIKDVKKAGAEIVKEIQDAKTENDAVNIIARLTSDWNAGM